MDKKSVGAGVACIAQKWNGSIIQLLYGMKGNISKHTAWRSFMSTSAPYVIAPVG